MFIFQYLFMFIYYFKLLYIFVYTKQRGFMFVYKQNHVFKIYKTYVNTIVKYIKINF